MIPVEAVEAAARGMCGTHPLSQWEYKSKIERDELLAKARQALEAAAPHMLSHEREQTRLAHLDALVNRDTVERLEQAIEGVLELAAPMRHMVYASEIRSAISNALGVEE